jgi:mannose-6-phosphate isomerase-like protein (cupin superfamily)
MRYRHTLDTGKEIGRPGVRGHPYSTHEDFARLSCGLFQVEGGRHGLIRNEHADRLYLVLEGEGRFTVAGESFAVQAGEVVIVPRQTPYDYEGRMKLFLVHAPANHDAWDISLEEPPRPATPPAAPDQAV